MNSARDGLTHAQRAAAGATAGDRARVGVPFETALERPSDRRIAQWSEQKMLAILTYAAAFDRVERGRLEAQAWLEALAEYEPADVKEAVTVHYRRSRFPVMPADVINLIEEGDI